MQKSWSSSGSSGLFVSYKLIYQKEKINLAEDEGDFDELMTT